MLVEEIVKGMEIDVEISYDAGTLGIWGNYKQALQRQFKPARFLMTIQDDVLVSRQSIEKAIHILQFVPDNTFVAFYNPDNTAYRQAHKEGHRILKTHSNFWSQVFCFPIGHTTEFVDWCELNVEKSCKWEDRRVIVYSDAKDVPIYSVIPSLFQHLGAFRSTMKIPAIIAGKYKRWSATFKPDAEVFNVDWRKEMDNAFLDETNVPDIVTHQNIIGGL